MKGYRMASAQHFELVDLPMPVLADDEVLVRILVCGVCASEYHSWENGKEIGKVFGHEGVGIVEKIGAKVTEFQPGDRVTGMMFQAFAEYTKVPAAHIVKVPEGLTDEEAVGEPLACMMSGVLRTPLNPGDAFAIVGTGYMGLGFMQMMRAKGAATVIAVDVREEGLANARHFGADETYLSNQVPPEYIVDTWDDGIFERGIPTVAEASGSQPGLTLAGNMTAVHGNLSVVGFHQDGLRTIDMGLWNWKAITVVNAHERRMNACAKYIESSLNLVKRGMLNTKAMATHRYAFEELNRAYYELKHKPEGYVKGIVRVAK
ncbi:alcohol dehydrogenase catalytic domain-containing protein [Yeguia hominis]|uniref:Alcohol dehydrogenase catalytic domain-containing protein n=1 Tax=Yeguia hominis TaxID=2763662 RepID=A0A926DBR5_9FIRM|nr:alcohol dehydrogenase catalytic domain-containing protein [Yeguia hominis]MBC8534952.1 alcohol dehydrogenase catalytic domain-containing protein [Yeguia hominis]